MEYPQSKFRIFVVEDDPMQSRLIKYVMESNPDHEVHVFDNGKDCLDQLSLKPDLVSLDYYLPDMDGVTILQKIKAKNHEQRVKGPNKIKTRQKRRKCFYPF